jgi:small-conductance mechanosensitive channel
LDQILEEAIIINFFNDLIKPISIFFIFAILGLLTEKIILMRLLSTKIAKNYLLKIIIKSFNWVFSIFFIIIGLHIALYNYPYIYQNSFLINKILTSLEIFIVFLFIARISSKIIVYYFSKNDSILPATSIISNVIFISVIFLGILVILEGIGISDVPILTTFGVGGLAVSLALQDTLSNFFAGIHILASKKIQPGNTIILENGQRGKVTDINWRNTTLLTPDNNMIIIPNSKISTSIITNYSFPEENFSVSLQIGISYDSDLDDTEEKTLNFLKNFVQHTPGCVKNVDPTLRYQKFDNSCITFSIYLRVESYSDQFIVLHKLIKSIHKFYSENNIEIPYPIQNIILEKSNGLKNHL